MSENLPPPWFTPLTAAIRAHVGHVGARYAQLATVRSDGRPANRTVVVRDLIDSGSQVVATTDARSAKAAQLAAVPWAELCWYFPETREQFRLFGRVTVVGPGDTPEHLALRTRVWSALPDLARRSFTWPDPGAARAPSSDFRSESPADPPACFLLLVLDPDHVEHLDLREQPHARTRFQRGDHGWSLEAVNP
jgi:PPOX class probable FMN-dependent enzyme